MTVSVPIGDPKYSYFTTGPNAQGWCHIHGNYVGWTGCPYCVSTVPSQPQTVTTSPVSTEDAIAAMVKAFNQLINDLREQVAERDQLVETYRRGECPNGCHLDDRVGCSDCPTRTP